MAPVNPVPRLVAPFLFGLAAVLMGGGALAQGEGQADSWQDRSRWDWGQHRMGFAGEGPQVPAVPLPVPDHWDYPGAPVRFAEHGMRG